MPATDNNQTDKNTYTSYLAGHVYENNVLQFFSHEEGRIRPQRNSAGVATGVYYYDYFIKDHLGNTRMVLTDEKQIDAYPVASLEAATINSEKTYYDIPDASRIATSEVPGYPVTGASNAWVQRLNGNGQKTGTSIVLRVMSGDKVSISADSWYASGVTPGTPSNLSVADLIASLAGGIAGSGGASHSVAQIQQNPNLQSGLGSFLTNVVNADNAANGNLPKSYLNYVLFDEQLNVVITNDGKNSGIDRVGSGGALKSHQITQRPITRNGYLYIYVSNETPGLNVIFDNLKVTHVRGELTEETHYYPFGLTMAGISSKAAGKLENKKRYNGIEFSEDFDVDTYDAFYRSLDPQTGRWWQIDPKIDNMEAWSPYASMFNNPVLKSDPLGDEPGPGDDKEPKRTEHFRQATDYEWQERPIHAAMMDLGFFAAEFLGLTAVDNAITTVGNKDASIGDKAIAIAAAGLATAIGEGGGKAPVKTKTPVEVKITEIQVPAEFKVPRELLNEPKKAGMAPTFKADGTSVEIHHVGQNPEGPYREMHWQEHRGKGNDNVNHPDKGKPSKIDRSVWRQQR